MTNESLPLKEILDGTVKHLKDMNDRVVLCLNVLNSIKDKLDEDHVRIMNEKPVMIAKVLLKIVSNHMEPLRELTTDEKYSHNYLIDILTEMLESEAVSTH